MKKALKTILLATLAIGVLFPALDCKKESKEISVRLKWVYYSSFARDIVSLEKGIFEKNSLNVEIHEGGFNLNPIKLVAPGGDQIGYLQVGPYDLVFPSDSRHYRRVMGKITLSVLKTDIGGLFRSQLQASERNC